MVDQVASSNREGLQRLVQQAQTVQPAPQMIVPLTQVVWAHLVGLANQGDHPKPKEIQMLIHLFVASMPVGRLLLARPTRVLRKVVIALADQADLTNQDHYLLTAQGRQVQKSAQVDSSSLSRSLIAKHLGWVMRQYRSC